MDAEGHFYRRAGMARSLDLQQLGFETVSRHVTSSPSLPLLKRFVYWRENCSLEASRDNQDCTWQWLCLHRRFVFSFLLLLLSGVTCPCSYLHITPSTSFLSIIITIIRCDVVADTTEHSDPQHNNKLRETRKHLKCSATGNKWKRHISITLSAQRRWSKRFSLVESALTNFSALRIQNDRSRCGFSKQSQSRKCIIYST